MKKARCLFHLVVCAVLQFLPAAYPQDTASRSPLRPLESGLGWTVDIKARSSKTPHSSGMSRFSNPQRVKEENWLGKGLRSETLHFQNGESIQRFGLQGMVLYWSPENQQIEITESNFETPWGPLEVDRIEELKWVKPTAYIGEESVQGIPCAVYATSWPDRSEETSGSEEGESGVFPAALLAKIPKQEMRAYINLETRLPVLLKTPEEERWYTFFVRPEPAILPQAFQDEWNNRLVRIEKYRKKYKIPQ